MINSLVVGVIFSEQHFLIIFSLVAANKANQSSTSSPTKHSPLKKSVSMREDMPMPDVARDM